MTFRLRPQAEADLQAIAATLAADNPAAAARWLATMLQACMRLGEMPGMGAPRFDVRPGLRLHPVGNYLLLSRATDGDAEIVRVMHGARQWRELL
jgi:toxin ParE1/3/4